MLSFIKDSKTIFIVHVSLGVYYNGKYFHYILHLLVLLIVNKLRTFAVTEF